MAEQCLVLKYVVRKEIECIKKHILFIGTLKQGWTTVMQASCLGYRIEGGIHS